MATAAPASQIFGITLTCKNFEEFKESESNLVVMATTPYHIHSLAQTQDLWLREAYPTDLREKTTDPNYHGQTK